MKILNLEEFRKCPSGTLFSKYSPYVFDGLMVKGETLEYDFIYQNLIGNIECHDSGEFGDKLEYAKETGESISLDFDCMGRDGLFEKNQLFAIYEEEDVKQFIKRITK